MGKRRSLILYLFLVCRSAQSAVAGDIQVIWSSELMPENPVWFTEPPSQDKIPFRLSRQADLIWSEAAGLEGEVFIVDEAVQFQTLLGMGTSLEDTSVYAIRKGRTEEEIRKLLRKLVDPVSGLGFSLFRITIGTSDFSDARAISDHPQGYYSYQDIPDGPFSIQNDFDLGIVQTLQALKSEADTLNPPVAVKYFASCWSPPGWMKTSGSLIGGTLKAGYEPELAKYFRKFIEAYDREGIPIYAITIQNEPNFVPSNYPGMRLSPQQEERIARAVYRELRETSPDKKRFDTRIWINDHNFEYWKNAEKILNGLKMSGEKSFVDAVAFHNYSNSPASNMTLLHDRHPDVDIHLTEHSEWGVSGMRNIQSYFRNWSRSYVYWVTISTRKLDEHNQGPYNSLGELSPTLLIQDESSPQGWYPTPEYYLISNFSRFIRPGAVRIQCDEGSEKTLTAVAFRNPDDSVALVLVNQTTEEQPFGIEFKGKSVVGSQPPKTVGTYLWQSMD